MGKYERNGSVRSKEAHPEEAQKEPRISQNTLNLADERKKAKSEGNTIRWSQLNREVTRSVKKDKKCFIEIKG